MYCCDREGALQICYMRQDSLILEPEAPGLYICHMSTLSIVCNDSQLGRRGVVPGSDYAIQEPLQRGPSLLSPARVMGPPFLPWSWDRLVPVAGRLVIVTGHGAAGQFGWPELAGLPRVGFWRCR